MQNLPKPAKASHLSEVAPPPPGKKRIGEFTPNYPLQRSLGASHLMQPGGLAHNPARDTRDPLEHQADARSAPRQAS